MRCVPLRSISFLLSLIVVLAVGPVLAVILYSGLVDRSQSIDTAKRDLTVITHSMAEVLTGISHSVRQTLFTLSLTRAVQQMDIDACTTLFQAVAKEHPEYLGITLVTIDGTVIASNRPFRKVCLADRKHVRDAIDNKRFSTGEYILTRVGQKRSSFSFAAPVLNKHGTVKAVLTAVLRLDSMAGLFDVSKMPADSFIGITDHQGIRIFYHPPKPTNPIGDPIRAQNWQFASGQKKPGGFIRQGSDGIRRVYAFTPLLNPDGDAYMMAWAGIPEGRILASANASLTRNLLSVGLIAGLALVISLAIGRLILIRPIKNLVFTTMRFARGDLHARSPNSTRPHELDTLAKAFDDMAEALATSQAELIKRQAHLEEAQRIGHMGSWEWDTVNQRFFLSKELSRIVAVSKDSSGIPFQGLETFFSPESARTLHASMDAAAETSEPFEAQQKWELATGTSRWLLVCGEPMTDEAGKLTGLRGTAMDITERVHAENERQRLSLQLAQAQKLESVGRLAGGVAHDFNNMLSIIIGHIEIALDDIDPSDPLHSVFMEIRKAAERSSNLVRQLLAFARKQNITPKVIDLNDTVDEMISMLKRIIGEDIILTWIPDNTPCILKMDPGQIDQILANLCVNARDAIKTAGRVTIRTFSTIPDDAFGQDHEDFVPGDYIQLVVSDNGCGMDAQTRSNIFEPFFTTKDIGKGTGLGLATIFGIIKQNKGYIEVESEVGRGTTIKIALPRFHGPADIQPAIPPRSPGRGQETILLVEDQPELLRTIKGILERSGYQVLCATTPGMAVDLARSHADTIDLLITDVIMPEKNGLETSEQIQPFHPQIKTLFMSGYTANVIAHHGVLDGGINFIQKPFSKNDLETKVWAVLHQHGD